MVELVFLRRAFQRCDGRLTTGDDLRNVVEVSRPDEALVLDRAVALLLFEPELALLEFRVGGHAALAVSERKLIGGKIERVEAGERDELELVSHGAEFLLEAGDGGVVELLLPVEGRRA